MQFLYMSDLLQWQCSHWEDCIKRHVSKHFPASDSPSLLSFLAILKPTAFSECMVYNGYFKIFADSLNSLTLTLNFVPRFSRTIIGLTQASYCTRTTNLVSDLTFKHSNIPSVICLFFPLNFK